MLFSRRARRAKSEWISTENHDLHFGEAARTWKGRVECRDEKHITFERFWERGRKEGRGLLFAEFVALGA